MRQSKLEHWSGIALNCVVIAICLITLLKGGYQRWIVTQQGFFEPMRGVVCDERRAFCADAQGISLPLTEQYFGQPARRALQAILKGAVSRTVFTLSNGVVCDSVERQCYIDATRGRISLVMTETLYSSRSS